MKSSDYTLTEEGNDWTIVVPIGTLRKQKVFVRFGRRDEEKNEVVTFSSVRGPTAEKCDDSASLNAKLAYGAFAVDKIGESDAIVIQANFLAQLLAPLSVTQALRRNRMAGGSSRR